MFIKLVRIGKDAEVRQVGGKSVLNVNVAYDVGFGQNKKTQWLRLALWGDRAEKSAQYMTKGKQLVVRVDDLHIREHDGKGYLEGTLVGFEYVSDGNRQESEPERPRASKQNRTQSAPASSFEDDSDLPF